MNKELQKLSDRHVAALRLQVAGVKPGDIQKQLGVSGEWLHRLRHSAVGQAKLEELRQEATQVAFAPTHTGEDLVEAVLKKAWEWIEHPDFQDSSTPTREQLALCDSILDRWGTPRNRKLEAKAEGAYLNQERLRELNEIAAGRRELLSIEGGPRGELPAPELETVDAEFTEIETEPEDVEF